MTSVASPAVEASRAVPPKLNEKTILLLVAAVQFVNILDFMMVMPLGPDFATALGIPTSNLGIIGGSYTGAAAISGLIASRFLDRFDRRVALATAMIGLVIGTALGGAAIGLNTLLLARIVAGMFGGPATAVSLSIIADVVPPERRGKAMGAVMIAYSIASVVGVPVGLQLAGLGGWRMPFFAIAGLGLIVTTAAITLMPSMRGHLARSVNSAANLVAAPPSPSPDPGAVAAVPSLSLLDLLREPSAVMSLCATGISSLTMFMLIPNIASFVQLNRGYPRDSLWMLYAAGGTVSLLTMRSVGSLVDKLGAPIVAAGGTLIFSSVLYTAFVMDPPIMPVMLAFMGFMGSSAFRNVALNAQATRVPLAHQRAGFMSTLSAVQHSSSAAGAFLSAKFLRELPDGRLDGVPTLALITMLGSFSLPPLLFVIERRLRAREGLRAVASTQLAEDPVS